MLPLSYDTLQMGFLKVSISATYNGKKYHSILSQSSTEIHLHLYCVILSQEYNNYNNISDYSLISSNQYNKYLSASKLKIRFQIPKQCIIFNHALQIQYMASLMLLQKVEKNKKALTSTYTNTQFFFKRSSQFIVCDVKT